MAGERSRYLSESIERPADEVYAYAVQPTNVPEWAPGLGTAVERDGDRWYVESPMGRVQLTFVERNDLGVLDHTVILPSGESFSNPMRVIPDGEACEVVFTLRRQPGMTDEEFERDAAAVSADLARLKRILESRG
jgi:polyketide cyclase/dehydrase/lipid transport protein